MEMTKFALDAILPIVRPDSVVRPMTKGLYGLYTPSSWPSREDGTLGFVLAISEDEDELVRELRKIGNVAKDGITWLVTKITVDADWWRYRAEDGMIPESILEGKL